MKLEFDISSIEVSLHTGVDVLGSCRMAQFKPGVRTPFQSALELEFDMSARSLVLDNSLNTAEKHP